MRRWKKGERLEKGQEESFIEFAWSQGASSTRAISKGAGARLTEKDYAYLGSSWKDLSSHGIDKERASYHSYLPYMYIYIYIFPSLLISINAVERARTSERNVKTAGLMAGERAGGGIYWAGSIGVVLSTLSPDVDKRRAATTRRSAEGGGSMVKSFRASIHLESEK